MAVDRRQVTRSEFNAAVSAAAGDAAAPGGGVTWKRWTGAGRAFNKDAVMPLAASGDPPLDVDRLEHVNDEEIPESAPGDFLSSIRFGVYVCVQGTDPDGGDEEDQADEMLDYFEGALAGQQLPSGNYITIVPGPKGAERLHHVNEDARGRVYVQIYQVITE